MQFEGTLHFFFCRSTVCPGKILHLLAQIRPTNRSIGNSADFRFHTEVMRFVKEHFCMKVKGKFALKAKGLLMSLNEASSQFKF